jgi:glutamate carboxypeptidase
VGGKFHTQDEYCEIGTIVPRGQAVLNTILRLAHTQW